MLNVNNIRKEEISTIFNLLNSAFCNDNEKSSTYFDILKYIFKNKKELILNSLSSYQLSRFKSIYYDLKGYTNPKKIFINKSSNKFYDKCEKENDVKKLLINDYSQLSKILKKEIKLQGCEYKPLNNINDSIDMYFRSSNDAIAVELKVDVADHSVIGQIDKYTKYLWARAFALPYYNVIGVIIANKFTDFVYQELKNKDYICVQYGLKNDSIYLQEV